MVKILKWISVSLILAGVVFFLFTKLAPNNDLNKCAFCDDKILEYQKFYEDDLVIALYTHKPIFPGHSLIIPKRHVERFEMLSEGEMVQIAQVIKKVNHAAEKVFGTSSYLLLQKNGKEVGQTVSHVHFHYIPRKMDDDSTLKFFINIFLANVRSPIKSTEMQEVVEKMKMAIEEK